MKNNTLHAKQYSIKVFKSNRIKNDSSNIKVVIFEETCSFIKMIEINGIENNSYNVKIIFLNTEILKNVFHVKNEF